MADVRRPFRVPRFATLAACAYLALATVDAATDSTASRHQASVPYAATLAAASERIQVGHNSQVSRIAAAAQPQIVFASSATRFAGFVAQPVSTAERSSAPSSSPPEIFSSSSPAAGEGSEPRRVLASWYGRDFQGRPTASGEPFDMHDLTAAHRTLPFGTPVEVRNPHNGRSVVVRINDRGPHTRRRGIDLSYAAARELGIAGRGTARVDLRVLR